MSTFRCEVVPVTLLPHPNADALSLVQVFGFTCVVRTVDWVGRDRGVYVPVDAVVPDRPEFAFLDGHRRVKARRLRGVFSMGLLLPAPWDAEVGDDLTEALGAVKYEPPEESALSTGGEDAPAPSGHAPAYTDVESLRRYADVLVPGEEVVVTEKIHGCNARYTLRDGALHCGSRTRWKRDAPDSVWWRAARATGLEERLAGESVLYGEVYGQVQDLRYGAARGEVRFRAFDVLDPILGRYLDEDPLDERLRAMGVERAPVLYRGPFDIALVTSLAEADSAVDGCGHLREGVVVKPVRERYDPRVGRVILKLHSQRYLLRKGA